MTYRERDMCGRKARFTSKQQAQRALNTMRQRDRMHAYQCEYCHWWHIGHKGL